MDDYHRIQRNDELMQDVRNELFNMHSTFIDQSNPVILKVANNELWLTQMHAAEIHELLVLMKDVKDCEDSLTTKDKSRETPPTNPEVVATFNQTVIDKYKALIGKRVRHKRQGYIGVVQSIDGGYLCVLMETGPNAGNVISYLINVLESNNFLQVVEN